MYYASVFLLFRALNNLLESILNISGWYISWRYIQKIYSTLSVNLSNPFDNDNQNVSWCQKRLEFINSTLPYVTAGGWCWWWGWNHMGRGRIELYGGGRDFSSNNKSWRCQNQMTKITLWNFGSLTLKFCLTCIMLLEFHFSECLYYFSWASTFTLLLEKDFCFAFRSQFPFNVPFWNV